MLPCLFQLLMVPRLLLVMATSLQSLSVCTWLSFPCVTMSTDDIFFSIPFHKHRRYLGPQGSISAKLNYPSSPQLCFPLSSSIFLPDLFPFSASLAQFPSTSSYFVSTQLAEVWKRTLYIKWKIFSLKKIDYLFWFDFVFLSKDFARIFFFQSWNNYKFSEPSTWETQLCFILWSRPLSNLGWAK